MWEADSEEVKVRVDPPSREATAGQVVESVKLQLGATLLYGVERRSSRKLDVRDQFISELRSLRSRARENRFCAGVAPAE